ncbi:protein of unknown function [Hyphomicrobium sp. MC1]|nr:protein of unknown function [Hyphomicrobium sp. MC1]
MGDGGDMNTTHVDRLVGSRLKSIRGVRNLSLSELAQSAMLSVEDYVDAEAGARRFRAAELFRIAKKLDISMADILEVLDGSSRAVVDDVR